MLIKRPGRDGAPTFSIKDAAKLDEALAKVRALLV